MGDSGRYDVPSPGVRGSVRAMSKYKMYACICVCKYKMHVLM